MGRYGTCGRNSTRPCSGRRISPRPNGQMPAIARNSVLLPVPDGPVIRTASPRVTDTLTPPRSGWPFGSTRSTCSRESRLGARRDADPADLVPDARDRVAEADEPINDRAPLGDVGVRVDDEAQRLLD